MRLPWRAAPPPAPARPGPDGPGGTREMPAVTAAAAPAFERLGDAVVRTDDPRAAAARQQLIADRARARRERVDPIPIPGRGSGPYSKPHSQPATSLRLGDSGLLESQLAAAGPAMARVAPPAMRHSFLQYDAAARRLVHDGRLVTWSPDPDPGPPPPIYRQLADERLHDPRTPDVEETPVSEHRHRDDDLMPIPSSREVFDPDRGADGGGQHAARDGQAGEVSFFPTGGSGWGEEQPPPGTAPEQMPGVLGDLLREGGLVACPSCGTGVHPARIQH